MPRRTSPDQGIVTAQLNGEAHRLLRENADRDTCVAELRAITTDSRLLGRAAGIALGSWRHWQSGSHVGYDGDRVARMLDAAGADPAVRDEQADYTFERLAAETSRPGIGMPS